MIIITDFIFDWSLFCEYNCFFFFLYVYVNIIYRFDYKKINNNSYNEFIKLNTITNSNNKSTNNDKCSLSRRQLLIIFL